MYIRVVHANYQAAHSGSAVGYLLTDKETGLGKGTVGKPVDPPLSLLVRFPNPLATGSEAGNLTRSLPG